MATNGDAFTAQTDRFVAWLSEIGVQVSPSITIADLRSVGRGRGVVATRDIASGETLFKIADRRVLIGGTVAPTSNEHQHQDDNDDTTDDDDPWTSLLLQLLEETSDPARSRWAPYLAILPSRTTHDFDTPMFWSATELAALQASHVRGQIGRDAAEAAFHALLPRILADARRYGIVNPRAAAAAAAAAGVNADADVDAAIMERLHALSSLIMAYAFDVARWPRGAADEDGYISDEEEAALPKAMVPLADLLNADAERNNARLFYEEDGALVMRAVAPVREGEELFNDYGPLATSELVRRYGYVTEGYAQYDVVDVGVVLFCDVAEEVYELDRETLMEKLADSIGCDLDELPESFELQRSELADLQHRQITGWLEPFPILAAVFTLFPSARANAKDFVAQVLQRRLDQYDTSIEQDQAILAELAGLVSSAAADRGQRRLHMALRIRMGEKEILRQAISQLKGEANGASEADHDDNDGDDRPHKRPRH